MNENQSPSSTQTAQQPVVLTVSQITNAIKLSLESTFPLVWLQGEISNFKPHTSGHLYFSLKDANAQISAVMFRGDASTIKFQPKDGTQVVVRGEINVFPAGGRYQILIREMRPVGLGELLLKLEELKQKLHKMGWFKNDRKKPLPKYPKRIGIVTSPTGAVIQDVLNILSRRFAGFHLILYPVKVQGEGAAKEIAQAIDQMNLHNLVDVMIVGRGGGSIEDLWAFNEEVVAEAIFRSKIPIISAVGHETDHCIADYVADVRAPTPSAAAEIVIGERGQQLQNLTLVRQRLQQSLTALVRQDRRRLEGIYKHPIFQSPYYILGPWIQRLDTCRVDLQGAIVQELRNKRQQLETHKAVLSSLKPTAKLQHYRQKLLAFEKGIAIGLQNRLRHSETALSHISSKLDHLWKTGVQGKKGLFNEAIRKKQLETAWIRILETRKEKLVHLKDALHAVNPKNLLQKGYCIAIKEPNNEAISSVRDVKVHDKLLLMLADGEISTLVQEVTHKKSSTTQK